MPRGLPVCSVSSARSACTRRVISEPITNTTPDDPLREDDGVGHGEHRRRVDDHPVERAVREVRDAGLFIRSDDEQLRRVRRRPARR